MNYTYAIKLSNSAQFYYWLDLIVFTDNLWLMKIFNHKCYRVIWCLCGVCQISLYSRGFSYSAKHFQSSLAHCVDMITLSVGTAFSCWLQGGKQLPLVPFPLIWSTEPNCCDHLCDKFGRCKIPDGKLSNLCFQCSIWVYDWLPGWLLRRSPGLPLHIFQL